MDEKIAKLKKMINESDALVIGAGLGLSISSGYNLSGQRFSKYFSDFQEKFSNSGEERSESTPFESPEEYWAFWSRYIYLNRYENPTKPVYSDLLELIENKNYFIITTNIDHCFLKYDFNKEQLFYTNGDLGLFQCSVPCCNETYENKDTITKMILSQGFFLDEKGRLKVPSTAVKSKVDNCIIPICTNCGKKLTVNIKSDETFVEPEGYKQAKERYENFLKEYKDKKILFLELGVGDSTPETIKYSFWKMAVDNPKALYGTINEGEAVAPKELQERSVCINGDIGTVLKELLKL